MQIRLDFRSHIPIYAQIVEAVKHQIALGRLKPGDQLPTVRELATDLRVNFNTVARAYRLLDEDGVISTQQGRGTYILEQPAPTDQKKIRRAKLAALTRGYLEEARRLGYAPDEVEKSIASELKAWSAEQTKE
jgi:GntR family transcriptional regulator